MKKIIVPMIVLTAWATSLSAQITREQADEIVFQHIKKEVTPPYLLFINVNSPSDAGISITTYCEEAIKAKYAFWAYYLNENPGLSEPCQHRYLFVKENDGNLIEVITSNDIGPEDLAQWEEVTVGIAETTLSDQIIVFPNPTTGEFIVTSNRLQVIGIEIFDFLGRSVGGKFPSNNLEGWQAQPDGVVINISHLPIGIYLLHIDTEQGEVVKKVIKH